MISIVNIAVNIEGTKESAKLICDDSVVSITLILQNGFKKTYSDSDFYRCFSRVREDNVNISFLCKGSKINVYPSSMASQMSLGLKAYEFTIGKTSSIDDVIYIFEYDENNLTNDPEKQRDFYMTWIKSKKK